MLTLTQDQVDLFTETARDGLAGRVMEFLRTEREEAVGDVNEETLNRRIQAGLAAAWAIGMRQDVPLTAFAAMQVEFGPHFERHTAVASVLADPEIAPDELVDVLLERLPSLVWDELAILGAGADWDHNA